MQYDNYLQELSRILTGRFNAEIHDWDVIKQLFNHFYENNCHGRGHNIVDFIDRGCWDHIENVSFVDAERRVELKGGDDTFYHAEVESIIVIEISGMTILLIKAYYQDKKTLRRIYSPRARSINITGFGEYMVEVERTVRSGVESIQIPSINCYTTCIITRPSEGGAFSNSVSENIMHDANLNLAVNKFASLIHDISGIDEYDRDALQEKGNTARRYFEYILMLINLRAEVEMTGPYQRQMLGDLSPIIHSLGIPGTLASDVSRVPEILNACSHHGGTRIVKGDLLTSTESLLQFCHQVQAVNFYEVADRVRDAVASTVLPSDEDAPF